jgi:hypothetical protein
MHATKHEDQEDYLYDRVEQVMTPNIRLVLTRARALGKWDCGTQWIIKSPYNHQGGDVCVGHKRAT